jgi:hypothetical protein
LTSEFTVRSGGYNSEEHSENQWEESHPSKWGKP